MRVREGYEIAVRRSLGGLAGATHSHSKPYASALRAPADRRRFAKARAQSPHALQAHARPRFVRLGRMGDLFWKLRRRRAWTVEITFFDDECGTRSCAAAHRRSTAARNQLTTMRSVQDLRSKLVRYVTQRCVRMPCSARTEVVSVGEA